jgi:hypothetical protein
MQVQYPLLSQIQYSTRYYHKCSTVPVIITNAGTVPVIIRNAGTVPRYYNKCMYSTLYSCQVLINLYFSRKLFEKYPNTKCNANRFIGGWVVACGPSDGRTYDEANSRSFSFLRTYYTNIKIVPKRIARFEISTA